MLCVKLAIGSKGMCELGEATFCVCVCVCVQGRQGCFVYFYNKPMDIVDITKALLILGKSFATPFIFIIQEDFDVT